MKRSIHLMGAALTLFGLTAFIDGCAPTEPNELDKLGTVTLTIKGKQVQLWIADSNDERLKGLMFVTAEQMAPLPDGTERGMIFIFPHDETGSFWMKNTIIPLDIAYISANGTVVTTHTMAALDDRPNQYPATSPYRYTIELNANRFADLGLKKGDKIEIPDTVLKRRP